MKIKIISGKYQVRIINLYARLCFNSIFLLTILSKEEKMVSENERIEGAVRVEIKVEGMELSNDQVNQLKSMIAKILDPKGEKKLESETSLAVCLY